MEPSSCKRKEENSMQIEGFDIYVSEYDGKPVKNKLPAELRNRFLTENQWLEKGYIVKDGMVGYEMHSTIMGKKLFTYYLDTQVEEIRKGVEMCANCKIRDNRFCILREDYINMTGHCSEWTD